MTAFAAALSLRKDLTIRMAAVLLLDRLHRLYPDGARALEAIAAVDCTTAPRCAISARTCWPAGEPLLLPDEVVSEIFLDNLKTATPWITKQGNLRLLTDFARSGKSPALHIATHLSNLIKVSDRVTVRHSAGNALLALAPRLTADQRNEVAVELCRGLELGQQEFTKYIPDYLGRFALWLPPAELNEVLADLRVNLSSSDSRVTASVLDTVGVIYEAYDVYRARFPETDDAYRRRRERLLGLLMRGLCGIDDATRQEALYVLGRRVFGSGELGRHEKRRAFMLTQRKLLSAQDEFPGEGLTFYYRAAMLGKLYRFITEERLFHRGFDFGAPRPVAFFPGTFDPFTLSHKGIVKAIRDLGYEVLLAIDEFSWSKKTQPYRLRRRIAAMSVADVFHVSIFPEDFPVNIANPDLRELRQAFPGRSVSIVVGSDVVLHASSYKKPVTPDSIHTFDHVVFRRTEPDAEPADYSCITGKVLELTLPPQLEEISSTRIREAVDANRDISNLIDPAVQEFIYRRGSVPARAAGQARSPHRGPELPARLAGDGGEIPPHHAAPSHRRRPARSAGAARRRCDGLPGHRRHHSGRGQLRLPGLRPPLRPPGRPGPLRSGPPERRRPHPAHQRAVRAPGRTAERPLPAAHHGGADPGSEP